MRAAHRPKRPSSGWKPGAYARGRCERRGDTNPATRRGYNFSTCALPLIFFNLGAQRLKLSTIGLMQYLSPTLQLAIGVLVFGEAFTGAHGIAFGLIWVALAIYSADAFFMHRARQ